MAEQRRRPSSGRGVQPNRPPGRRPSGSSSALRTDRNAAASGRERAGGSAREGAGTGQEDPKSASSKLFDLRWLIAAMFVVYGVVLIVTGIFDNKAEIAKAAGVRINLWTGLGMLVVGLVFAGWARLRPLRKDDL